MRKILFFVAVLAGVYAFYEQTKPNPNVWISALCIMLFMIGLLFLSKKVNNDKTDENIDEDFDMKKDENEDNDK